MAILESPRQAAPRAERALVLALLLVLLTGCASPAYYAQAISGHCELMNSREAIADLLEDENTDPDLAQELALALELREFAITELGLPDNDSYLEFASTGREAVTWNVVAAPEFSLQPRKWCFPVAGCVTYRGYFDRQAANRFAESMVRDGYDVAVSPAVAYSTLGWFDDPLLDTMLQAGDEQLAAMLFHELAHQKIYIKGDTAFNEAYAGFVEEAGVKLWLESSGRIERLAGWVLRQEASQQFNQLVSETRQRLADEYASGLPAAEMRAGKERVFSDLAESYQLLVDTHWDGRSYYGAWITRDLNNAHLALINDYRGGACAFESLYRAAGKDILLFHKLSEQQAELDPELRAEWLNQPCEVIASSPDL